MLWLLSALTVASAHRGDLLHGRGTLARRNATGAAAANGTNGTSAAELDAQQVEEAVKAAAEANAAAAAAEAAAAKVDAAVSKAVDYKSIASSVYDAAIIADQTSQQNLMIAERQTPPYIYAHTGSEHGVQRTDDDAAKRIASRKEVQRTDGNAAKRVASRKKAARTKPIRLLPPERFGPLKA